MPLAPQVAVVTCSACGRRFTTEVYRIIDVGHNPEHKRQFLRGRLNQAICPQCGQGGMLSLPLLYHDPSRELAVVFLPDTLGLVEADRQRLIGSLTNEVMASLPPEQRKGYLFQPEIVLRLEGLMERILAADGITKEMLEAQRAKMELIDQFLAADEDEERLKELVAQHRESLDYEFFHSLTAGMEAARTEGQQVLAERLLNLRAALLELSDLGRSSRAQQEMYAALEEGMSREEVLEKLIAARDEPELHGMVVSARPLLDYQFFLVLSNRIESASGEKKHQLEELRERLLTLTEELDKEAEAALARSSEVLRAILESEDPKAAVRKHLMEIDDLVVAMLSANVRELEARGEKERAAQLRAVWATILSALEERMPPEIRLVNQLLALETESERQALMQERSHLITEECLQLMEAMAANLSEQGHPEVAERLRMVQGEVRRFLEARGRAGER